jgi:sugar phosphate isomerase/epimerase
MRKAPLRIGTTSYIKPADIIPNVQYLGPQVDDIELVLFESEEASNLPDDHTIDELVRLARTHQLSYTVHFPLDIYPGSRDEQTRGAAVSMLKRIVTLTEPLDPFGYVLHLTPDSYGPVPSDDVPAWIEALDQSLHEILDSTAIDPTLICAETLSYPFELVHPLVEKHDLSVTLDIGHIWLMDFDSEAAMDLLLERTRIYHLHGVSEGKDHLGLDEGDGPVIERFLERVVCQGQRDQKERVLTLEVFGEREYEASRSIVQQSRAMMGAHSGGAYGNH